MAIITRRELFCWRDVDDLGDLQRLKLVLDHLPDEGLMRRLERRRGGGRNDYPVRAVWNTVLAAIVFQHPSIESLRRELLRNAQLRELCGFKALDGIRAVPPPWVYTRFLARLQRGTMRHRLMLIFEELVGQCMHLLPGFGENLAGDGKALSSFARTTGSIPKDRRGEHDANWGKHEHRSEGSEGTVRTSVKKWFGFTVHVVADTKYELPVAFCLTKASRNEKPVMRKLFRHIARRIPGLLTCAQMFAGDRGYDDTQLISMLWDQWGIKPIIDICNHWRDGEQTKVVVGSENVLYDYRGNVFCSCPQTGKQRSMAYGGFEADRGTLKYRCPAHHYGVHCKGRAKCPIGKAIRIPLHEDRRVFTPLARSSYSWKTQYKKRTAIERVNSRLDVSFGFEQHTIRGHNKMAMRLTMGFAVMLALAVGRVKTQQSDNLRSLVRLSA